MPTHGTFTPERTAGKPALSNGRAYGGDDDDKLSAGKPTLNNGRANCGVVDKTRSRKANFTNLEGTY